MQNCALCRSDPTEEKALKEMIKVDLDPFLVKAALSHFFLVFYSSEKPECLEQNRTPPQRSPIYWHFLLWIIEQPEVGTAKWHSAKFLVFHIVQVIFLAAQIQ